jgi:hypothetical protein
MSSRQERRQREAYLNEQVTRQQRGEPVDVEWVRAELARVRQEQKDKLMSTEGYMRWMVMGMAGLFCVLWIAGNVVANHGPRLLVPIVMIATLAAWSLYRRKK